MSTWVNHDLYPHFHKKLDLALSLHNANRPLKQRLHNVDIANEIEIHQSEFSRFHMRNGTTQGGKKIAPVEFDIKRMQGVARALGLSSRQFLGADAWIYFTDKYTYDEFENALDRVSYGRTVSEQDLSLSNSQAFFQQLDRQYGLVGQGISVHVRPKTLQRGLIGRKREANNVERMTFEVGDRVFLEVLSDKLGIASVFAVVDVPGAQIPNVILLSPSFAVEQKEVYPGRPVRIPDAADFRAGGGFEIFARGRIDFLCILLNYGNLGLSNRVAASPDDYYTFTSWHDLNQLLDRLFKLNEEAEKSGKSRPVLLHKAILVN